MDDGGRGTGRVHNLHQHIVKGVPAESSSTDSAGTRHGKGVPAESSPTDSAGTRHGEINRKDDQWAILIPKRELPKRISNTIYT